MERRRQTACGSLLLIKLLHLGIHFCIGTKSKASYQEILPSEWLASCGTDVGLNRLSCRVDRNIKLTNASRGGVRVWQQLDVVGADAAMLDFSQGVEFFLMGPNSAVSINRVYIYGAILPDTVGLTVSDFLILRAFQFAIDSSGSGSSPFPRLRLQDVTISTPSCLALYRHQKYACGASPSLNFTVAPGVLHVSSFTSATVSASNVTLKCGSGLTVPPCTASVVNTAQELFAGMTPFHPAALRTWLDAMPPVQQSVVLAMPAYLYVNRSIALRDAWKPEEPSAVPSTGMGEQQASGQPVLYSNPLVIAGSVAATPSAASPTILDLGSTAGLIKIPSTASVELRNLTLVNLPLGPRESYPAALLGLPLWTFDFARYLMNSAKKRSRSALFVRDVAIVLGRSELALWHADFMDAIPDGLAGDFCAYRNGLLFAGLDENPTEQLPLGALLPSGGLFVKRFSTWNTDCMQYDSVSLLPASAVGIGGITNSSALDGSNGGTGTKAETAESDTGGEVVISVHNVSLPERFQLLSPAATSPQPPVCQLNPAIAAKPAMLSFTDSVPDGTRGPVSFMAFVLPSEINNTTPQFIGVFEGDVALNVASADPFGSFSGTQVKVSAADLWFGDPAGPLLLQLSFIPAAINLHDTSASLTLRHMVLAGLAPAGLHPSSPAWTTNMTYGLPAADGIEGVPATLPSQRAAEGRSLLSGSGVHDYGRRITAARQHLWGGHRHEKAAPGPASNIVQRKLLYMTYIPAETLNKGVVGPPAGADPTGGLPAGMANFTSCLWALDFDRSSYRAFLDSVMLLVPARELAVLSWVWAEQAGPAPTHFELWPQQSYSADAMNEVRKELQAMLGASQLAAEATQESLTSLTARLLVQAGTQPQAGIDAGFKDSALTFETFSWCGLLGRNVTLAAQPPPAINVNISGPLLYDKQLDLPLVVLERIVSPISPQISPPDVAETFEQSSPPTVQDVTRLDTPSNVAGDNSTSADNNSTMVALASAISAGAVFVLGLVCLLLFVRKHKQYPAAGHVEEPKTTRDGPDLESTVDSRCSETLTTAASFVASPCGGGTTHDAIPDNALLPIMSSTPSRRSKSRLQPYQQRLGSTMAVAMASLFNDFGSIQDQLAERRTRTSAAAVCSIATRGSSKAALACCNAASGSAAVASEPLSTPDFDKATESVSVGVDPLPPSWPRGAPATTAASGSRTVCGDDGIGSAYADSSNHLMLLDELGRGAQGVVFRARWKGLHVAVKSLLFQQGGYSRDPGFANAIREAAIATSLNHGNIVATYTHQLVRVGQPLSQQEHAAVGSPMMTIGCNSAPVFGLDPPTTNGAPCDRTAQAPRSGAVSTTIGSMRQPVQQENQATLAQPQGSQAVAPSQGSIVCLNLDPPCPSEPAPGPQTSTSMAGMSISSSCEPQVWRLTLVQELCDAGSLRQCLDSGLLSGCRLLGVPSQAGTLMANSQGEPGWQPKQPGSASSASISGPIPLPLTVALLTALQVARGMEYLHSLGVLHGDLSSSNVLLQSAPLPTLDPQLRQPAAPVQHAAAVLWGGWCPAPGAFPANTQGDGEMQAAGHVRSEAPGSGRGIGWQQLCPGWLLFDGCLYGYGYAAKVSDFGLSGRLQESQTHLSGHCRRSLLYSAPELVDHGVVNQGTDVYAFAVLMYEIVIGMSLQRILRDPVLGAGLRDWLVAQQQPGVPVMALAPGLLRWAEHVPQGLVELVGNCLAEDPGLRPRFSAICSQLTELLAELLC